MEFRINKKLLKNKIWEKYTPYLKPDNKRITTSVVNMAMCDLGVTDRTVFNILAGNVSMGMCKKIMLCYDIKPDELFIKENIED